MKNLVILATMCFAGCATTSAVKTNEVTIAPTEVITATTVQKECYPSQFLSGGKNGIPALILHYKECLKKDNLLIVTMPAQDEDHKEIEGDNALFFVSNYVKSHSKTPNLNYEFFKKEYYTLENQTDVVFYYLLISKQEGI